MSVGLLRVGKGLGIPLRLRNPSTSMFLVGLLLMTLSLLLTYRHTAYTSDDVMFQNALLHWRPFSGDIFFDNRDGTFILQAPLYWLVSLVIPAGRYAMLADGILLTLVTFGLVYYALLYFLKVLQVKISWVSLYPVILLSIFGYGLNRLFLGTNYHTLAVGFIFVLLMLVSKLCRGELTGGSKLSRVLIGAAIALFVGLCIVNDRYFVYYGLIPSLGLVFLYLCKNAISLKRAAAIACIVAGGYGIAVVIQYLLPSLGVLLAFGVGAPTFVDFNSVSAYFLNTLHSLCYIMGINFFGQPVVSVETVVSLINLTILSLVVVASAKLMRTTAKAQPELMILIGLFWFAIVVYAMSGFNLGTVQTFRYLTVIPFLAVAILAVYAGSLQLPQTSHVRHGMTVVAILIVAVGMGANSLGSIAATAATMIGWTTSNGANIQLIHELQDAGATKGYAEYWSSHINTYLSQGRLSVQPVLCDNGTTSPYTAFIDKDKYLHASASSFYVFVPSAPLCTEAQVRQQFGDPASRIVANSNIVWVYNYDIGSRMNLKSISQR